MREDPIVAEVRRTREELAARFHFDVKAIFADMRSRQNAWGARLASPKKRPKADAAPQGAALPQGASVGVEVRIGEAEALSLFDLAGKPAADFWKAIDAGEKPKPGG